MINRILKLDWILLSAIFLLLGIGLAVLYSISGSMEQSWIKTNFARQLLFVGIGLVALFFFAFTNFQYFKSYPTAIYFATLLILLVVLLFGTKTRGTAGWLSIGPFNIQPVEIAKLSLIIFLSGFIAQKKMELSEVGRLIASFILLSFMLFLVIKQPDFGSAMVLLSIWAGMVFVSGISRKLFIISFIIASAVAFAGWFQLADYQKERIINFVRPEFDPQGSGYNVIQSIIAVGSGGLAGKGIGHGSQSQLNFLPEKHTDFIFASIAEELGFVGSAIVIGLFFLILFRIRKIAAEAPDNFGFMFCVGVMVMIFVQVLINIGMNMGIMPVTGIPLPLVSYGGSSMIMVLATFGIVLNIYSRKETVIRTEEDIS